MCATIAAMAVQITKTQIATAMAAEISDIVSSFTFMILLLITVLAVFRVVQPDGGDPQRRAVSRRLPRRYRASHRRSTAPLPLPRRLLAQRHGGRLVVDIGTAVHR